MEMEKRPAARAVALCLALLLLAALSNVAFAQVYAYEPAANTATVRNPTVTLSAASLSLDGHAVSAASCGSSPCVLAISTTLTSDVIVVITEGNSASGCSVSDGALLTWNTRTACQNVPSGSPTTRGYGVYWAVAIAPLTSDSVSVAFTSSNFRLLIFAVNGANTVSPFDPSVSIPSYSSANPPTGCVMTTSYPEDFLFSTAQQGSTPTYTVPSGFTPIDHTTFGEESEDAYQIVTSAQVGVTETWGSSIGTSAVVTTCDAIRAAGNLGTTSIYLNTYATIAVNSPVSGAPGTAYYENANGPVPCTVTPDTVTTPPATSGSFTFTSAQSTCLVSPVFSSATSLASGPWLSDLFASTTSANTFTETLQVKTAGNVLVGTVFTGNTGSVPTTKTEIKNYFSGSAATIPAGDYLVLLIAPTVGGTVATYTLYWGSGQLTNFQQPNTYGYVLAVSNPSGSASWLINLGYVSSSNGRITNMTAFLGAPISKQIIIGTGIGSPTPPNSFGPAVTLGPSSTKYIGLGVSTGSAGTTVVTITLKIQAVGASSVMPYAQDTIVITVS
jgi:hypothetical protein